MELSALEQKLGYVFKDQSLLAQALVHPSIAGDGRHESNNQRLEYLGDAVIELAVSQHLYKSLALQEGALSRLRAGIVSETPLAQAARSIGLGQYIDMSGGERRSGGEDKPGILSDAFEAVCGAMFVDGGFERAAQIIINLLGPQIMEAEQLPDAAIDYKTRLQEYFQALGHKKIKYELERVEGPSHTPSFVSIVRVDDRLKGRGSGSSKKESEQNAARQALERAEQL